MPRRYPTRAVITRAHAGRVPAGGAGNASEGAEPPRRWGRGLFLATGAALALTVTAGVVIALPNTAGFDFWRAGQDGPLNEAAATPVWHPADATPTPTPTATEPQMDVAEPTQVPGRRPSRSGTPRPTGEPTRSGRPTPPVQRTQPTSDPRPTRTTAKPSSGSSGKPTRAPDGKTTSKPTTRATKKPTSEPKSPPVTREPQLVELGPGRFTAYCRSLGWEWVEYRTDPEPGAYCVMRKGDTMLLNQAQRDAGCRWRYQEPKAFHRFKGKSNYCYLYR